MKSPITEIHVTRSSPHSLERNPAVLGYASVVVSDFFVIKGIRIIHANGRRFLSMPSRPTYAGGYEDQVHPINDRCRSSLEKAVFEEFDSLEEEG